MKLLISVFLLCLMPFARGAVIASNGTIADIQNIHDAGTTFPGDIITIPASETPYVWTSTVLLTKGVSLRGAGSGRILTYSSTSVEVGTGPKTFNVQTGLTTITANMTLRLERTGVATTYMEGTVVSYNVLTGALAMTIATTGGNGTPVSWLVTTLPQTTVTVNSNYFGLDIHLHQSAATHVSGIQFRASATTDREILTWKGENANDLPIHLRDCWFRVAASKRVLVTPANRGLIYRCSFDSAGATVDNRPNGSPLITMQNRYDNDPTSNNSWLTPHTMGTADTTGLNNIYIEDCDIHWFNLAGTDIGDRGRIVIRYNLWNHSSVNSHGSDSGAWGVRHMEVYDNKFVLADSDWSYTQPWWVWIRGGTGVVTNNDWPLLSCMMRFSIMNLSDNQGPNPMWGKNTVAVEYPAPRQPGLGYISGAWGAAGTSLDGLGRNIDGYGLFIGDPEPAYIWNNSINLTISDKLWRTFGSGYNNPDGLVGMDNVDDYIVKDRDFFLDIAKPSYTKYEYPHPLQVAPDPSGPTVTTPTISPSLTTQSAPQSVSISGMALAAYYYTLDGTTPTESSTLYTAPFTVGYGTTTVKVKGFRTEYAPSGTATKTYVITALGGGGTINAGTINAGTLVLP